MTAHSFCTGIGPGDTRITTRYDGHQFSDGFFGILHEVGHWLYEQGLPAEHLGTPMGEAVSLGVRDVPERGSIRPVRKLVCRQSPIDC